MNKYLVFLCRNEREWRAGYTQWRWSNDIQMCNISLMLDPLLVKSIEH